MANTEPQRREIHALKVRQWLPEWDEITWAPDERRSRPGESFCIFSISARDLKALSGVYARKTARSRGSEDQGIQRRHEESRSEEIGRFVKYGYPWSDLSEAKRQSAEFADLRQPGWLPTAIVVNILTKSDERLGESVADGDAIDIRDDPKTNSVAICLPESYSGPDWQYTTIPPIEVIDGQHRLWAFEDSDLSEDYQLPVVAFSGLDLSWQAYLFYTINIKPKKINPSLAYDLYPLLRAESWLEKFEGHSIYRETRAQEIVDILWSHEESPWHHRINMLGEPGRRGMWVTQAAWVRSLLAAFIKSWEGQRVQIGGLYGAKVGSHRTVLAWDRDEQAAFLILAGRCLREEISQCSEPWAEALRTDPVQPELLDAGEDGAFVGPNSLLNQDQGIRTFLHVLNDICFVRSDELGLHNWGNDGGSQERDADHVKESLETLMEFSPIADFTAELARGISSFDWRASSAPGLSETERQLKSAFRGSGGYKELRRCVIRHLMLGHGSVASAAADVASRLGY